MSDSKQQILAALRKHLPEATQLPRLDQDWTCYPDPVAHFQTVLRSVGGDFREVASPAEFEQELKKLAEELQSQKICTHIPGLGWSTFDVDSVSDPHELEDVDLAILPGAFGVAENGAIWVEGDSLPHRVILFIAQHVVLVISRQEIVSNMHEAYARLEWQNRRFGVFVSGPSKTADIEQSLVIGAHGARSMTVFITDFTP